MHLGDRGADAYRVGEEREPFLEGVAGKEAGREQAHLRSRTHHHPSPAPPNSLGPLRAVGEEREQLLLRETVGEGAEPDLEPRVGRVPRGDLESVGVAAGDADGGTVQVVADDLHLAAHDVRIEGLAGARALVQEAGVEVDALGLHGA